MIQRSGRQEGSADPHLLVIMGASGDLARRKLIPAYFALVRRGAVAPPSAILGAARSRELDDHEFRNLARASLREAGVPEDEADHWCAERLYYQTVGEETVDAYRELGARIEQIEREHNLPGNRVFYLALPPNAFPTTIGHLGQVGLNRGPGWTRLVIEKPFGRDLQSAERLNALVHEHFEEQQVYRIDHYLGKETVQNLLVFRFANPVWEALWNRDRVESVRIQVAEALGIEGRGGYYEQAGALRDMVQNHLTQLLTLVAMEVPGQFAADGIRHEKVKVLRAIGPIRPEDVVYGQYTAGEVEGKPIDGYLDESRVRPDSRTPTFAGLRLFVNTWRWQGVPFYLTTGKAMAERLTRITVTFRCPPVSVFGPRGAAGIDRNVLEITLQPNEGFALRFEVKAPGQTMELVTEQLDFRYGEAFGALPEAYETLLYDVLVGDQTLFVHADETEASWALYTPLLENPDLPVHPYPAGSWGPEVQPWLQPDADRTCTPV